MDATRRDFLRRAGLAGAVGLGVGHRASTRGGVIQRPRGLALTIGLDAVDPKHYGGYELRLASCESDARDIAEIARKVGFETTILLREQATRQAVLQKINEAAEQLKGGDIYLLQFSGGGGQLPDADGDEEDGKDETWLLYDGQLVDDELYSLWTKFEAGVRILVLNDSSHGGTITARTIPDRPGRAIPVSGRTRRGRMIVRRIGLGGMAPPPRPAPRLASPLGPPRVPTSAVAQDPRPDGRDRPARPPTRGVIRATVLLISACQDNQLSSDGTFNGLFTSRVKQVWANGEFRGDYRQFHRAILERMPPTQLPNYFIIGAPNPQFEAQRPFTI